MFTIANIGKINRWNGIYIQYNFKDIQFTETPEFYRKLIIILWGLITFSISLGRWKRGVKEQFII